MKTNVRTREFIGILISCSKTVKDEIERGNIHPSRGFGYLAELIHRTENGRDSQWSGMPKMALESLQELHKACVNAENQND